MEQTKFDADRKLNYLEQIELKLTGNTAKGFHSSESDKTANNAVEEKRMLIHKLLVKKEEGLHNLTHKKIVHFMCSSLKNLTKGTTLL